MTKTTTKQIPITVLTGFLGSGKTTLINKIIKNNPQFKFALIINEFGEVGVDGKLIENYSEEIMEISDGCICCVVQTDLLKTVVKLIDRGDVDYILIETSGLAEPEPLINTLVSFENPKAKFDSVIAVVDVENYETLGKEYKVIESQAKLADVVVLNKISESNKFQVEKLQKSIALLNPYCSFVENIEGLPVNIFIETNSWTLERLLESNPENSEVKHEHSDHSKHHHSDDSASELGHVHDEHCGHSHQDSGHKHHHEHDEVDEVVFTTPIGLNPDKLDEWLRSEFPHNAIRSKGILRLNTPKGIESYVFQMVGANKSLTRLSQSTNQIPTQSILVFIGKGLDKKSILDGLEKVVAD
jgi:G3E family GTPase